MLGFSSSPKVYKLGTIRLSGNGLVTMLHFRSNGFSCVPTQRDLERVALDNQWWMKCVSLGHYGVAFSSLFFLFPQMHVLVALLLPAREF